MRKGPIVLPKKHVHAGSATALAMRAAAFIAEPSATTFLIVEPVTVFSATQGAFPVCIGEF